MNNITEADLVNKFSSIGICAGDTILIRAGLGSVGKILGGANTFIDALLKVVGCEGTIVSLAFTGGSFIRKPKPEEVFHLQKKSYAGALPNAMIQRKDSFRSRHPTCSYVAIGKHAENIITDHDENSPAYEPIRKIIQLHGKCILVGCVESSPGFTTAHLVEADLGLSSLAIFPWLHTSNYTTPDGKIKTFRRKDLGLCSQSYYKFYAFYVTHGILKAGTIGNAYSILVPAKECYEIEYEILKNNHKFNICDSSACFMCNAGRWDRIHRAPMFFLRLILRKILKYFNLKYSS